MGVKPLLLLVFVVCYQLAATEKPGSCPQMSRPYRLRSCTKNCRNDAHCAGNRKCCQTGCNSLCKDPISDEATKINGPCMLEKSVGTCRRWLPRWYYNKVKKRCEFMFYGGCGGNSNNFLTLDTCKYRCEIGESHAGSCPRPRYAYGICSYNSIRCDTDSDCRSNQKCCHEGCGRKCKVAVVKGPAVAHLNLRTRQRSRSPTPSTRRRTHTRAPIETRKPSVSASSCPVTPSNCPRWPSFPCNDNSHCSGGRLCCYTKCGKRCTSVQSGTHSTSSTNLRKPQTPRPFYPNADVDEKYSRYSGNGPCIHHCTTDADCFYGQVCTGRCSRMCRGPKRLNLPARGPLTRLNKPKPQRYVGSTTPNPHRRYLNTKPGSQSMQRSTSLRISKPSSRSRNIGSQRSRYQTTPKPSQRYLNQRRNAQRYQSTRNRGPRRSYHNQSRGPRHTSAQAARGPRHTSSRAARGPQYSQY